MEKLSKLINNIDNFSHRCSIPITFSDVNQVHRTRFIDWLLVLNIDNNIKSIFIIIIIIIITIMVIITFCSSFAVSVKYFHN